MRRLIVAAGLLGLAWVVASVIGVSFDFSELFEETWQKLARILVRLPLVLVGLVVLWIAWGIGDALRSWDGLLSRVSDKPLVQTMVGRILFIACLGVAVLITLDLLEATALVGAVLGTAGVFGIAVGFAFQDIIENYLAGFLLAVQQPFSMDDTIEVDGVQGVVVKLSGRSTLLLTLDGNHVYIPNAQLFKGRVTNFTRNERRRFDFGVGVGNNEDLGQVIRLGVQTLRDMPGVLDDPLPNVRIDELGDSMVNVHMYGWVDQATHGFLPVRTEAIRRIKEAFDRAGIDMPEPQYRVLMVQPQQAADEAAEAKAAAVEEPQEDTAVDLRPEDDIVRQVKEQREKEKGTDLLEE